MFLNYFEVLVYTKCIQKIQSIFLFLKILLRIGKKKKKWTNLEIS